MKRQAGLVDTTCKTRKDSRIARKNRRDKEKVERQRSKKRKTKRKRHENFDRLQGNSTSRQGK